MLTTSTPAGDSRDLFDMPRARAEPARICKSGRFSKLMKFGFTEIRWVIDGDYSFVVYPVFISGCVIGTGSKFIAGSEFGIGYEYIDSDRFFFRAAAAPG